MAATSMHSRLAALATNRALATGSFALASVAVLVKWLVLLFDAVPTDQTQISHAASMLHFVFMESEQSWFFYTLAFTPFLLLAIATLEWRMSKLNGLALASYWVVTTFAAFLCLVIMWPAAIAVAYGMYYHGKSDA